MRRLKSLGREGPILKELEQLPKDIESLYETILAECAKNGNPDERELLQGLFSWLAYAKSKLSIGEANILIDILTTEMSMSIEEELDGRLLTRLLRSSGSRGEQAGDDDSSEDDLDQAMDEGTERAIQRASDGDNLLGFQKKDLYEPTSGGQAMIQMASGLRQHKPMLLYSAWYVQYCRS